jgi:hypothetical protein
MGVYGSVGSLRHFRSAMQPGGLLRDLVINALQKWRHITRPANIIVKKLTRLNRVLRTWNNTFRNCRYQTFWLISCSLVRCRKTSGPIANCMRHKFNSVISNARSKHLPEFNVINRMSWVMKLLIQCNVCVHKPAWDPSSSSWLQCERDKTNSSQLLIVAIFYDCVIRYRCETRFKLHGKFLTFIYTIFKGL